MRRSSWSVLLALAAGAACGERRERPPREADAPRRAVGPAPTGPAPTGPAPTGPAPTGPAPTSPGAAAPAVDQPTPDALLARGAPTLIVGTLGDDAADRMVRTQAEVVRGLLPGATIVADTMIDVAAGPAAWPPNPVLYGGAHVNAVVAALGDALPVQAGADRIVVGGETFAGPGDRVIAAIPAGARHPAFVLYAGTGSPGIVDINALRHGGEPVLVGDAHGRLVAGTWAAGADGRVRAALGPRAPRIAWRTLAREVAGATVRVAFPSQLPAAPDDDALADAAAAALGEAAARLEVAAPPTITVYVYPDRRSKQSLTGDAGDGHAVALAGALHVVRGAPTDGWRGLLTHEATHVITGLRWGPAGSPLLGEGVAVWAAGRYGGVPLEEWRTRLPARPAPATLLPVRAFRARPEAETYPVAGLLVAAAVAQVGIAGLRDHLYGAPPDGWAEACARAGTTAEALAAAVAAP